MLHEPKEQKLPQSRKKVTDLVVQPMVKGDRAQHVLTGQIVTVVRPITVTHGSIPAYLVTGKGPLFRATEMELIHIPRDKWGKYLKGK